MVAQVSERTLYERVVGADGGPYVRGYKYIKLKSGRMITFWDAHSAAESAHTDLGRAISRLFKLADDDWDLERIEWILDHIERHIGAVRTEVEKRRGIKTREERIALLRNTTGRTPEEAAVYNAKADELERALTNSDHS